MNNWMQKIKRSLASREGHVIIGILFFVIGFIISALIQRSSNIDVSTIIKELLLNVKTSDETSQLTEEIVKIINTIYSPISVQSLIFACLSAFLSFSFSNILFPLDKKGESETKNDDIIVDFLDHLIEDCYSRCSNTNCQDGCLKLASECDGLLKKYLYEESIQLKESITDSKSGKYALDNNIERFHTIAIDHLIAARSRQYAVVQWIGSKPYSEDNKYQETYDMLDFHFLNVLLDRLTNNMATGQPYYKSKIMFKIKWLLIGDINCMKNNFDYIFYVIKSKKLEDVVKEFFEFYLVSEADYRTAIEPILSSCKGFCNSLLNINNKPSFGIFGENFIFADSNDPDHHGSIFTRSFNPDKELQDVITSCNRYFSEIISNGSTVPQDFDTLMNQYDEILQNDSAWEGNLKTIWHPEAH